MRLFIIISHVMLKIRIENYLEQVTITEKKTQVTELCG